MRAPVTIAAIGAAVMMSCTVVPAAADPPSYRPFVHLGKRLPARCLPGYVWRQAKPDDLVCVPPESRGRAGDENAQATARIDPNGAYGPQSCISGFVWREAFAGDTVCVAPENRTVAREENRLGPGRTQ